MTLDRATAVLILFYYLSVTYSEGNVVINGSLCGSKEMHVECYQCGPETCRDLGYPKTCKGAMAVCRSKCVCIDGYVRDANRKCIRKNECPNCGGDRNAISGCGNHCGNRCSDYKVVNKTCWSGCRYNDCDCRTGYVYDDKLRVCVHPNDCSRSVIHITSSVLWITITIAIHILNSQGIQQFTS